jgi:hypothetical protein
MVADLAKTKPSGKMDLGEGKLAAAFEEHMNNDLDVKGAFDSLTQKVAEIHQKRLSLSEKGVKNALGDLHRVDSVLQCIF